MGPISVSILKLIPTFLVTGERARLGDAGIAGSHVNKTLVEAVACSLLLLLLLLLPSANRRPAVAAGLA